MNDQQIQPWDDARIREAFIDDGGQADYYDPINGAKEQRRIAGDIFDRWLAAHDAEVRASVTSEESEWQYSYVERIGRYRDVHERVTFDSLRSAQQYLRDNADLIVGWNREVKKRDHKTAGVEKRQMNIGTWVPVNPEARSDA